MSTPEPTENPIPVGARPAARVLIVSETSRILLLLAVDSAGHHWWLAPGGGLDPGESFEAAAQREAAEETGALVEIGPWVWTRRHRYMWYGRPHDQYERYFVARATEFEVAPTATDSYVIGHRWWSLSEIQASSEDFTPRSLVTLLPQILAGDYPDPAIDCGV